MMMKWDKEQVNFDTSGFCACYLVEDINNYHIKKTVLVQEAATYTIGGYRFSKEITYRFCPDKAL